MPEQTTIPVTATQVVAARLSIAAVITYQVLLAAAMVIKPEVDPSWQPMSEYAIGRLGWITVVAFLVSAVSYGSLFVAVRSQATGAWGRVGLGVLLICTVGTVGVGVFVTDPIVTPPDSLSTTGTLHVIFGGTALTLLPLAALLINLSMARQHRARRTVRRALLWSAGLPLLGLVVQWVWLSIVSSLDGSYGPGVDIGWPPRFLFLTYLVWLITLARQVTRMRGQEGRKGREGPAPRHETTAGTGTSRR